MIELREPLATVLRGAARLMVVGISGTAVKGSQIENFAAYWRAQPDACLAFLTQETEVISRRALTIREADPELFPTIEIPVPHLRLAVCAQSEAPPLQEVIVEGDSYSRLYLLLLPSEPAHGVGVRRLRRF